MSSKPLHSESDSLIESAFSREVAFSIALDSVTRKTSLVVSLLALGLMIAGFIVTFAGDAPLTADTAVIPLATFWHIAQAPSGLTIMSTGIILLALLPSVRVALALYLYLRYRNMLEALVALVVLLELLLSMWLQE